MWSALAFLCAAVLSLAGVFLYLDPQIPPAESYRSVKLETPLRIFSHDGALIAEFGERRVIPISLDQVPEHFINALLDTEDKRFYQHSGIDFISLVNDLLSLVGSLATEGEVEGGASTITMQLARNVSFTLERRFLRKFKEMLLALKIERELSKDEILELYINIVPFGKRAYGAEAAALTYYGKPLIDLNLAQLAMLAGIPQAPSAGNPINGPERAINRRNLVLGRMRAQASITEADYQAAIESPITARIYARELDVASPYAAEWVRQQASALLPDLYTGGYEITTTLTASKQRAAKAAVRRGLIEYDQRHGYRGAEGRLADEIVEELTTHTEIALASQPLAPDSSDLVATLAGLLGVANGATEQPSNEDARPGGENTAPVAQSEPTGDVAIPQAYPVALREAVHDMLRAFPIYRDLEAGAVLAVESDSAIAQRAGGGWVRLQLTDLEWARPYRHVDLRGRPPEAMQDVVEPGDIVRLTQSDDRWQLTQNPEIQGALVALDPLNGAVRSLVGGFDFYQNQFNHALQAARQPGSGFKPFVYSAALAQGVTPADIYLDAPLVFDDENLESQYRPDNDNNRYNGPTRLREALYRSINLVSMRVLLGVGAGNVLNHAADLGFDTKTFPRNTQLAIGGGTMAITPVSMARSYAVLANGGFLIDPYIIDSIKSAEGELLFKANPRQVCLPCEEEANLQAEKDAASEALRIRQTEQATRIATDELAATLGRAPTAAEVQEALALESDGNSDAEAIGLADVLAGQMIEDARLALEGMVGDAQQSQSGATPIVDPNPEIDPAPRVLDERNAFIMHSMLRDVIARGTGTKAKALNRSDLAGKTGTTNDAADTWFNGYSPNNLVATVWVGFSNHDPLGAREFGSTTPLPIWIDYMSDALTDDQEYYPPQPQGVVTIKIDPETGERASPNQSNALFEYFFNEHTPERNVQTDNSQDPQSEEPIKAIDLF